MGNTGEFTPGSSISNVEHKGQDGVNHLKRFNQTTALGTTTAYQTPFTANGPVKAAGSFLYQDKEVPSVETLDAGLDREPYDENLHQGSSQHDLPRGAGDQQIRADSPAAQDQQVERVKLAYWKARGRAAYNAVELMTTSENIWSHNLGSDRETKLNRHKSRKYQKARSSEASSPRDSENAP